MYIGILGYFPHTKKPRFWPSCLSLQWTPSALMVDIIIWPQLAQNLTLPLSYIRVNMLLSSSSFLWTISSKLLAMLILIWLIILRLWFDLNFDFRFGSFNWFAFNGLIISFYFEYLKFLEFLISPDLHMSWTISYRRCQARSVLRTSIWKLNWDSLWKCWLWLNISRLLNILSQFSLGAGWKG